MMKPKEALVKDGFLPSGSENKRGRLSGAAIERCKELAGQGWQIEGYEVSRSTGPSESAPTVSKVKVETGVKVIADIGNPTRDEKVLIAKANGRTLGMRDVCTCGNSFTYCWCDTPTAWVDGNGPYAVTFHPRPTHVPIPGKFW